MTTITERIKQYREDSARYRQQADVWRAATDKLVSEAALERFDTPISYRRFEHSLGDDRGEFFQSLGPAMAGAILSRATWERLYDAWRKGQDAADLRDTQAGALEREVT